MTAVDKAPDAFRTISEVAEELDLPQHVLRFWETRFSQIRPMKRGGGRRYYRPEDINLLRGIKHLLYGEGYTIRGVQRILKDDGIKFVQSVWISGAPQPERSAVELSSANEDGTPHEPALTIGEGARVRGLFGLLPPLLGAADDPEPIADGISERIEPVSDLARSLPSRSRIDHDQTNSLEASMSAAVPLSGIDVGSMTSRPSERAANQSDHHFDRKDLLVLQTALDELSECRRLLDSALTDEV